jgi:hypothetical protein
VQRDTGRCARCRMVATKSTASARALPHVRLRPSCHARPMPGVRHGAGGEGMKRVPRFICNGLTILSLVVFAGGAISWLVAQYWTITIFISIGGNDYQLRLYPNRAEFDRDVNTGKPTHVMPGLDFWPRRNSDLRWLPGLRAQEEVQSVYIPYWFAVAPLAWLFYRRADGKRLRAGRCLFCGYDLRATPDRCPECGNVPEAKA